MKFFYTCQEAHQVISEGLDSQLNFSQRTHLAVHLGICRSCTNFKLQIQTLRLAMQQLSSVDNTLLNHRESVTKNKIENTAVDAVSDQNLIDKT